MNRLCIILLILVLELFPSSLSSSPLEAYEAEVLKFVSKRIKPLRNSTSPSMPPIQTPLQSYNPITNVSSAEPNVLCSRSAKFISPKNCLDYRCCGNHHLRSSIDSLVRPKRKGLSSVNEFSYFSDPNLQYGWSQPDHSSFTLISNFRSVPAQPIMKNSFDNGESPLQPILSLPMEELVKTDKSKKTRHSKRSPHPRAENYRRKNQGDRFSGVSKSLRNSRSNNLIPRERMPSFAVPSKHIPFQNRNPFNTRVKNRNKSHRTKSSLKVKPIKQSGQNSQDKEQVELHHHHLHHHHHHHHNIKNTERPVENTSPAQPRALHKSVTREDSNKSGRNDKTVRRNRHKFQARPMLNDDLSLHNYDYENSLSVSSANKEPHKSDSGLHKSYFWMAQPRSMEVENERKDIKSQSHFDYFVYFSSIPLHKTRHFA